MQTVCTMIGARRGIAAPALRAALVAGGALLTCGCMGRMAPNALTRQARQQ